MALGEGYSAPAIPVDESASAVDETAKSGTETRDPVDTNPDAPLIASVLGYLAVKGRPAAYYDRWQRCLAALEGTGHSYPMTAAEAQGYVDAGWGDRWPPIVEALRRREAAGA